MAFNRFPHLATLTWLSTDETYTTLGVLVPATLATTIALPCRVNQVVQGQGDSYVIGPGGDKVQIDIIVSSPELSLFDEIPEGEATLTFRAEPYRVLQVPPLQKHLLLKCGK